MLISPREKKTYKSNIVSRTRCFYKLGRSSTLSSTFRNSKTYGGISQDSRKEPAQARTQTEEYYRFRWPRCWRQLEVVFLPLSDKLFVGNPSAYHLFDYRIEPICIHHLFAVVVAERLLVQITEEMERLDADVGSL